MGKVLADKNKKSGFTTGSAAAAATKAALRMLLSGKKVDSISIITPAGVEYNAFVYGCEISKDSATCFVVKESGDDPDVTAGMKIYVTVRRVLSDDFCKDSDQSENEYSVIIRGGIGIGRVTRPGLDQPVGEAAINSVPRKMIMAVAQEVLDVYDCRDNIEITVWAPEGEEIAKKTFNPHMGIEGGISIIGTTGIVEPMSTQALIDTIKVDIAMQYAEGAEVCIMVPGNYGVTFLRDFYGVGEERIVTYSNFVGDSIELAVKKGFRKILFVSHIGKLIKVSGGIMNTHSEYGDHRMELMNKAFEEATADREGEVSDRVWGESDISEKIMNCVSTTAALDVLAEVDMISEVSRIVVEKAVSYMRQETNKWSKKEAVEVGCIMYENKYGELYRTENALDLINLCR